LSPKRINLIAAIVRKLNQTALFEFGNYSANTEVPADENIASQCCDLRDVPVAIGERHSRSCRLQHSADPLLGRKKSDQESYNSIVTGRCAFTIIIATCLVLVLPARAPSAPTVVVRDVQFKGELGVPVTELQEYMQFLKGHALEESKILKQSDYAIGSALRHRGFLKAQVVTQIQRPASRRPKNVVVLLVTIHAGLPYRIKEIGFSGLASEFSLTELRNAIPLRLGDIADAEQLGVGMHNLLAIFIKNKKNYASVPELTFDDAARTVSLTFNVVK
jgi:outer membrane protein assembly factor BamA